MSSKTVGKIPLQLAKVSESASSEGSEGYRLKKRLFREWASQKGKVTMAILDIGFKRNQEGHLKLGELRVCKVVKVDGRFHRVLSKKVGGLSNL